MKKSELNLDVLENAGNRALKKLSDEYVAVSEKEISRLFDKSEELYRRRKTESSDIQILPDLRKQNFLRDLCRLSLS